MTSSWSDKDERMYQHVRKSAKQDGKKNGRAKELAARTVNKQRRQEGRTPNTRTQGSGNPNTNLENRTVPELRNRASDLNISGRSKMKKAGLIAAIRDAS